MKLPIAAYAAALGVAGLYVLPHSTAKPMPRPNLDAVVVAVGDPTDSHGSGVYLGGGRVLTAAHVVKDFGPTLLVMLGKETAQAHVEWVAKDVDLALIKLDDTGILAGARSADLACNEPDVTTGADVEAVGFPLNMGLNHTWGHVSANNQQRLHGILFVADLTVAPGNSGGGVFTKDGKLVGIVTAMAALGEALLPYTFSIPRSVICSELNKQHPAPEQAKGTTLNGTDPNPATAPRQDRGRKGPLARGGR